LEQDRAQLESELRNRLGARVRYKEKAGGKGVLEIHFKGDQELQRIPGLLPGDKG
jgi:hypothetical protein